MEKQSVAVIETVPHLPVPLGTELLIEIMKLNLRIKNSLVGMEKGEFVLTKTSASDLVGTFRSDSVRDSEINISYFHDSTVYGFKSSVLNVVSSPSRLFFLAYPKKIEEIRMRHSMRYECILPATTMIGNEIVSMVIIDISADGCQCIIKTSIAKKDALSKLIQLNRMIEMMVVFPGAERKCRIRGKIRTMGQDLDKIKIGVHFDDMLPDAKSEFDCFIALVTEFKPE
ncbi:PilZ domain-containing protein [bacterium]|nr:MAG: PilZ domain-containing protein [bacterium]